MKMLKVTLTGVTPLLMANNQAVDPFNEYSKAMKAITSKHHTKRTEEDVLELNKLKFISHSYHNSKDGFYLPSTMVEGTMREAGKISRDGTKIKRGVQVLEHNLPVSHKGPNTIKTLWANKDYVDARVAVLGGSSIMVYRPRFNDWSVSCTIAYNTEIIDLEDIKKALETAGSSIGVGSYRPRFGRFEVSYK